MITANNDEALVQVQVEHHMQADGAEGGKDISNNAAIMRRFNNHCRYKQTEVETETGFPLCHCLFTIWVGAALFSMRRAAHQRMKSEVKQPVHLLD